MTDLPALEDVHDALRNSWARDTTDDPDVWSEDQPTIGQCAVSAMVVRAIYGWPIVIATVLDKDGERTPDGHAWNIRPNGESVDFTFGQFTQGEQLATPIYTEPVIDGDPGRAQRLADRVGEQLGIQVTVNTV